MRLSREFKAGIIVLIGIALSILGFSYLKSSNLFDSSKTFYAVYDHVGGLQNGTAVSISGKNVGKVKETRFIKGGRKILVVFSVNEGIDFSKNSHALLYDTGIIGGKGIQIIQAFDDAPFAKSYDTLASQSKPGMTELVQQKLTPLQAKVEDAVTNADSLLVNVNSLLDAKTKAELKASIEGLGRSVRSFEVTANSLNAVLSENKDTIDQSIKNIGNLTSNFSKFSDELAKTDLPQTLGKLEGTVDKLNALLSKVEKGEGSLGKMANDQELYDNLNNASRELDLLLQDFRLNPKRYVNVSVFGKKTKDYTLPEKDPADQNN